MTFINAITALSERFLTERSFELIVAPALADFAYDSEHPLNRRAAVLAAVAGAFWDDVLRGGHVMTFAGLALIPICYYTIWFLIWIPTGMRSLPTGVMAIVTVLILMLSLAPAIVCFWPNTDARRTPAERQ